MALLTGLLTHSHCLLFLINSMLFSLCLERTSAFIFVTLTERLVLSLSAGRRPPHYMYSDVDVNSQSFSKRLILLFPTWYPCFPSPLFSFPALCCHPFHQDCLPGASGVHLCFTTWLQGQKHPLYIQTFTHLLGLNPPFPNSAPSLTSARTLKWCPFKMQMYENIESKLLELQLIQSCARVNWRGWF